jgi:hypothetical protein
MTTRISTMNLHEGCRSHYLLAAAIDPSLNGSLPNYSATFTDPNPIMKAGINNTATCVSPALAHLPFYRLDRLE